MSLFQTMTVSCKQELLEGIHDFTTDVMYLALYKDSASLGIATTAYTATGETAGAGYPAGGAALLNPVVTNDGQTAYVTFDDLTFAGVTLTGANQVMGALIYNSSKANRSVCVLNFGSNKQTSPAGSITIQMPAASGSTAIIRVA